MLTDPDPDVRDRATAACRAATGPLHEALWRTGPAPGTPLRAELLASAVPPPEPILDALWRLWLVRAAPELGDALVRWNLPAADPEIGPATVVVLGRDRDVLLAPANRRALLAALDRDDHPVAGLAADRIAGLDAPDLADELCERALDRPALVPHCRRHGLVPRDPARRAVFHLLTGEPGQYRSLDPDGGLLALAYAAADKAERARIREALPATGDLDLVRVIAGDDRRVGEMAPEETRYLGERLARRRAWDELWTLVRDLPVPLGVELARLFDGWAPRDDAERHVFDAFRAMSADDVERALRVLEPFREGLHRTAAPRFRTTFADPVTAVAFSPRGRFLAVANGAVDIVDARTGRRVRRHEGFDGPVAAVLHLGDGTVLAGDASRLVRCTEHGTETLHAGPVAALARTRGKGFVAVLRTGEVLRGDPDGVDVLFRTAPDERPGAVAVDLRTNDLALAGRVLRMYSLDTGRTFTYSRGGRVSYVAFAAPGRLVCGYERGEVLLLRLSGGAVWGPPGTRADRLRGVGALPRTDEPVIVDARGLHVLDADLRTAGGRRAPAPAAPTCLAVSHREPLAAIGDAAGHLDLLDLADARTVGLPDLAHLPMADMLPKHLAPIDAIGAAPTLGREATALLRLVRSCLEHRFRFDVEIGDAVRLPATEYDIGL
ncbi:hypothetical protein BJF79_31170 [Actinomadura sp. CNU-125]|uniref:WD40 repeat domain-containing protein n=1 Tax=Actinomadura sp. CNU-125 TaxID=1904961 RepID=UPI000963936A|nr:hypothetical protein [Actinomadura sp. CNU-125]OLT36515.1 hypothetical protein BJF79_31170 [Actinomadura sp. CNU-125]